MNPNATNHPISVIRKYYVDGQLDLSPVFQRNPVWTDPQASYLVDSILNDLPIPEVYIRSTTLTDGETKFEVVDGQQRLRSIIRFFSNDLELEGSNVTAKWLGKSWDSITPDQQQAFWKYKLVIRYLEGASDAEVRDMFRRLNANQENLNEQELRHSQYHGEFTQAVEQLANDRWWLDHKVVNPKQIRRMLDVEYVAELLVGLIAGPLNKKQGLDDYFSDYDSEFPDRDSWIEMFLATRDLTKKLAGGSLIGWTSKTEFYSLFLASGRCVLANDVPTGKNLTAAAKRLAEFREMVNQAKRRDNEEEFGEDVDKYVQNVTRASTDLSRRLGRINAIHKLIIGE